MVRPDGNPSHVDASAPKRAPPSMVPVATIEAWVAGFLRAKKSGGWPVRRPEPTDLMTDAPTQVIYTRRRDASNLELLLDEGDDGGDAVGLGSKQVAKKMDGPGKRGYAGLLCAISFCLELRKSGKSATQRELYYLHKGGEDSPWRTQAECNERAAASRPSEPRRVDARSRAGPWPTRRRSSTARASRSASRRPRGAAARGGSGGARPGARPRPRFRRAVDSNFFAPLAGARGRAPSRRRR